MHTLKTRSTVSKVHLRLLKSPLAHTLPLPQSLPAEHHLSGLGRSCRPWSKPDCESESSDAAPAKIAISLILNHHLVVNYVTTVNCPSVLGCSLRFWLGRRLGRSLCLAFSLRLCLRLWLCLLLWLCLRLCRLGLSLCCLCLRFCMRF